MTAFFPDVPKIAYGGPKSKNPLEFKHYNPDEVVGDKTMKEHLRFSVVYWHTFCNALSDPFGVGTAQRLGLEDVRPAGFQLAIVTADRATARQLPVEFQRATDRADG